MRKCQTMTRLCAISKFHLDVAVATGVPTIPDVSTYHLENCPQCGQPMYVGPKLNAARDRLKIEIRCSTCVISEDAATGRNAELITADEGMERLDGQTNSRRM